MRTFCNKRLLITGVCLLNAVLSFFVFGISSSATGTDSSSGSVSVASLFARLDELDESISETSDAILNVAGEMEQAEYELAAAKLVEESQYGSMKNRIVFLYEGGGVSLLETLFKSASMSDFLNNAEYVQSISEYDANMMSDLVSTRRDIEEKEAVLTAKTQELSDLKDSLRAQQQEVASLIQNSGANLSSYKDKLLENQDIFQAGEMDVSASDTVLLAAILQCEAGSTEEGMLAVATVILNRVASPTFPNTIRGVVYAVNQFEPVYSGSLNATLRRGPSEMAMKVAKEALAGKRHAAVINCYYFVSRDYAAQEGMVGTDINGNVFMARWHQSQ
ncbi:MAG: cell wall hydrolase [Lachnospiraceae bacterium]|jgi:hypothetical protein|nr:cell wall hydrolase [Lachnospiraceae bacterium]